jgi:hypothetical protein
LSRARGTDAGQARPRPLGQGTVQTRWVEQALVIEMLHHDVGVDHPFADAGNHAGGRVVALIDIQTAVRGVPSGPRIAGIMVSNQTPRLAKAVDDTRSYVPRLRPASASISHLVQHADDFHCSAEHELYCRTMTADHSLRLSGRGGAFSRASSSTWSRECGGWTS